MNKIIVTYEIEEQEAKEVLEKLLNDKNNNGAPIVSIEVKINKED